MKLQIILFCCIILMGCKKDEIRLIENFEINLEGKGTLNYNNSECEFDNRVNQTQFNGGAPNAKTLFSTYRNLNESDSTLNRFSFELQVEYSNEQDRFTSAYLRSLLESEDSNENTKHLYPHIQVSLCGKTFNNDDRDFEIGESIFKIHDNFKYKINDYEVLYHNGCVGGDLLFLDITIEGMLYQQSLTRENDSLYLNESNMKVLFDID